MQEEYDRFLQKSPPGLTAQEKDQIRALATDIPALWSASTTTAADRKEIIRCLLERVDLCVQGATEYVDVTLHWMGGYVSQHQLIRRVQAYEQCGDFERLIERTRQLREAGHTAEQIANRLNDEGFHSITGDRKFHTTQVRQLLVRWNIAGVREKELVRSRDEWLLGDLAKMLRMHESKLRRWIRLGWAHARQTPIMGFYIVRANRKEMARLKRLRDHAEAHPYQPYPAALTAPSS